MIPRRFSEQERFGMEESMRVLYVAPRYHTNQTAVMEGWKSAGDEVCFLAHYAGRTEDYSVVRPEIIGYSRLFLLLQAVYLRLAGKKSEYAADMKLKCGFPPVRKLYKKMKQFRPDVVITRERSFYSIVVTFLCRLKNWPVILYYQSPLYEKRKESFAYRVLYALLPQYSITPVRRSKRFLLQKEKPEKVYFIPFLRKPQVSPEEKTWFQDGRINLFCIGKYQKRKNHMLMIRTAARLSEKYPVHLVIAGEVSNSFQEAYYEELNRYVEKEGLRNLVELRKNLSRKEVFERYRRSDVFVLPSSDEPAAVSHLEAMAFSLPVISGDDNGTADYIENGRNGYIFRDQDAEDLYQKIEKIIEKPENVQNMGAKSYELVLKNHQFSLYKETILEIIRKMKEETEIKGKK